jgi:hypothetical protein
MNYFRHLAPQFVINDVTENLSQGQAINKNNIIINSFAGF